MKTRSSRWTGIGRPNIQPIARTPRNGAASLHQIRRVRVVLMAATAMVAAAAWMSAMPGVDLCLYAAIWAAGIVFLARAAEPASPARMALSFGTGTGLMVLALLAAHVSADFAILASCLPAARLARAMLTQVDPEAGPLSAGARSMQRKSRSKPLLRVVSARCRIGTAGALRG